MRRWRALGECFVFGATDPGAACFLAHGSSGKTTLYLTPAPDEARRLQGRRPRAASARVVRDTTCVTAAGVYCARRGTPKSRRTVAMFARLGLVAALWAVAAVTVHPAFGQVRAREDIDDLTDQELADFIHAFQVLKDRPANRMDSLRAFQRLHNGGALPNGRQGGCQHESEDFLTWHRHLLYDFERALQAADPPRTRNVTLPYWNFTKPPTGVRFPRAFEVPGSVLRHDNRLWPDGGNQSLIADLERERAIRMSDERMRALIEDVGTFRDFAGPPRALGGGYGRLEGGPHNWIHNPYTQGDMITDTRAALDPLFWPFHAYVDLLYDAWQREHGAFEGADPQLLPSDLGRTYDHFETPLPVRRLLNVEQHLGYRYEPSSGGPPGPFVLREIAAPDAADANTLKFAFSPPRADRAAPADRPLAARRGAQLELSGVTVPFEGSWQVDFFVHPKDVESKPEDPEFQRKYLSDYFVRWKGEHRPDHGEHGDESPRDVRVLLLSRLAEAAAQAPGEWIVTVHFRPLGQGEAKAVGEAQRPQAGPSYRAMSIIAPAAPPTGSR